MQEIRLGRKTNEIEKFSILDENESGYRTVPSRRYRRRRDYEYRQDLMYLSMVICISSLVFAMGESKWPSYFVVVAFWLSGSFGCL